MDRIGVRRAAALLLTMATLGCLERDEKVRVHEDGGVTVRVEFDADSLAELYGGDPVPSEWAGWQVEVDDANARLVATSYFPAGSTELPAHYAQVGDRYSDRYVNFPTTVRREVRSDGVYYHFRRVYPRLEWTDALFAYRVVAEIGDEVDDLAERAPVERAIFARDVGRYLLERQLMAARYAWVDVADDHAAGLAELERRLRATHAWPTPEDLLVRVEQEEEWLPILVAERDVEGARAVEEFLVDGSGFHSRLRDEFRERRAWYLRRSSILLEEFIEIELEMPGVILGTNSTSVNGSTARWEFDAADLSRRSVELAATSFVAADPPGSASGR